MSDDTYRYSDPRPAITTPEGLIDVVPYLLGFHPGQDAVIIGTDRARHAVRVTLRYPLDPAAVTGQVRHALALLARQHYDTAVAVGYGPGELVTPFMDWLRAEAGPQGIRFTELLRVDTARQRYWSYHCAAPDSCPPEGTPYELKTGTTADSVLAAAVPGVLANRAALAQTLAAVDGEEAVAMTRATRTAQRRVARLLTKAAATGSQLPESRAVALAGITAMCEAIQAYHRGATIGHQEAAWLTVSLSDNWVRDDAVARMDPAHLTPHLRLLTDLTRLARPRYTPAPATLLAYTAWQAGNGSLANVALDRALTADPGYPLATILRDLIPTGIWPMPWPTETPEEIARIYTGRP